MNIDDLDGGRDDQKGYKSLLHGIIPDVRHFDTFQQEVEFIVDYLQKVKSETGSVREVCLTARTKNLLKQYESAISEKGFDIYPIRRSEPEDQSSPGLRLATMHRVKGLEFDHVIIVSMNEGIVPLEAATEGKSDAIEARQATLEERALVYVALTRARAAVQVVSYGRPSFFLSESP